MPEASAEELPSLLLEVRESSTAKNKQGMFVGAIQLVCVTRDEGIFDAAVQYLDGYKMYGSTSEEVIQALTAELHDVEETQASLLVRNGLLERRIREKDARIAQLERLLGALGTDLGFDD